MDNRILTDAEVDRIIAIGAPEAPETRLAHALRATREALRAVEWTATAAGMCGVCFGERSEEGHRLDCLILRALGEEPTR